MDRKTFCMLAGIIFTLVALFHLVRIFEDWSLTTATAEFAPLFPPNHIVAAGALQIQTEVLR